MASNMLVEWDKARDEEGQNHDTGQGRNRKWFKPPPRWLKINTDTVCSQGNKMVNYYSDFVPNFMQDTDNDAMDEIQSRREVEDFPILIASGGERTSCEEHVTSSSLMGGIPVENVVMEDWNNSDDEAHHESH
ncbi:hypothetical protein AgCh_012723 [Apium graveolens]